MVARHQKPRRESSPGLYTGWSTEADRIDWFLGSGHHTRFYGVDIRGEKLDETATLIPEITLSVWFDGYRT
jgi:hypothetical protein